jgi:predicted acylesterase/phospholipase RssA
MDELPPCDLVMKGGITSGVVYPGVVLELMKKYRFCQIGGASAGAIAAVLTAAAEYGRQSSTGRAFAELAELEDSLKSDPNFIVRLFQPAPAISRLFSALLAFVTDRRPGPGRYFGVLGRILVGEPVFWAAGIVALALWSAFVAVTIWALAPLDSGQALAAAALIGLVSVPTVLVIAASALAGSILVIALRALRSIQANNLGMCSGLRATPEDPEALTEWLHRLIQSCAGRPLDSPLTFADLEQPGNPISLTLITTDLSFGRPVTLPLRPGEQKYLFDPERLQQLLPGDVVRHMVSVSTPDPVYGALRYMPSKELPIVVAARMSLSFPILLSTVPLYWMDERELKPLEHTFSDGGISSNFPIHLFDGLLTGRPTFGIELQPYPGREQEARLLSTWAKVATRQAQREIPEPFVLLSKEPRAARWTEVRTVAALFRQILDSARNWRDTMQAEMPSSRDRICQIRLSEVEGGLNLNMSTATLSGLVERGHTAGRIINDRFDWTQHRLTRYRTFMHLLQKQIVAVQESGAWSDFRPVLQSSQFKDAEGQLMNWAPPQDDPAWRTSATAATDGLLAQVESWTTPFEKGAPLPIPVLRVVPDV